MTKKGKRKPLPTKLVGVFDHLVDPDAKPKPTPTFEPREVDRALIMFWRKEKCERCHTTYTGSCYHAEPMLQVELQKPIVHFGKLYGYKYVGTIFRPVADLACYDSLPRQVEIIHSTVRVCPKCIHKPNVIYLTFEGTGT